MNGQAKLTLKCYKTNFDNLLNEHKFNNCERIGLLKYLFLLIDADLQVMLEGAYQLTQGKAYFLDDIKNTDNVAYSIFLTMLMNKAYESMLSVETGLKDSYPLFLIFAERAIKNFKDSREFDECNKSKS